MRRFLPRPLILTESETVEICLRMCANIHYESSRFEINYFKYKQAFLTKRQNRAKLVTIFPLLRREEGPCRAIFCLRSPTRPVRDQTGAELSGLEAAHWHAVRLSYRLREHAAETGEDWVNRGRRRNGRRAARGPAQRRADAGRAGRAA
jgi:hypothetical protein